MLVPVNYLAVFVGGIIYMIVGSLWYSPALFAKSWMKLVGKTMKDLKKQNMGKTYGITFFMEFLVSYILSQVIFYTKAMTPWDGLLVGFFMWIGFAFATAKINYLFEGKPFKLLAINYGYHLTSFILIGMLLAVWK